MSVNAVNAPSFTAYPSGSDPRLPQGEWYGRVTSTGDATGGSHQLNLTVFPSSHTPTGQVFSLDQVTAQTGAGATVSPVLVQASSWDYGGAGTAGFDQLVGSIELNVIAGSTIAVGQLRDQVANAPVFLGAPIDGADAQISVRFVNDDTVNVTAIMRGKWWVPEARYLAGGPVAEGSVSAPLPLELTRTPYYSALRSGQLGELDLQQLRAAAISQVASRPATAAVTQQAAQLFQPLPAGPQRRADRQVVTTPQVSQAQREAVISQLSQSLQTEQRLRVAPRTSTRAVQAATGAPTAISALIASAPAGISVKQFDAFNRASAILADPRFARTES